KLGFGLRISLSLSGSRSLAVLNTLVSRLRRIVLPSLLVRAKYVSVDRFWIKLGALGKYRHLPSADKRCSRGVFGLFAPAVVLSMVAFTVTMMRGTMAGCNSFFSHLTPYGSLDFIGLPR